MDRSQPSGLRSTAAMSGHPLRLLLVTFPIVFLSVVLLTDPAFSGSDDASWARASVWLIGAGLVGGALATAAGLIDFIASRRIRSLGHVWYYSSSSPSPAARRRDGLPPRSGNDRGIDPHSRSSTNLKPQGVKPMKDDPELSRRRFLGQCLSGAAIAGTSTVPALALNRMNKVASHYQNHPHGEDRCGRCKHFQAPSSCEIVPGNISPNGWCHWFSARR